LSTLRSSGGGGAFRVSSHGAISQPITRPSRIGQPLDLSFELLAVPEPVTFASAVGGLVVLAMRWRRAS
jgi:hypothetical protein